MGCCGDCCVPPKESREPIRYDPTFNGPVHRRSCTDITFLILFILFLGVWGFVGYYSMKNGNFENVLAPMDSRGRRCGLDAGLENKKYLVFFDISKCLSLGSPITGCQTPQVCVEKCPQETILFDVFLDASNFESIRSKMVCTEDVNTATMTYQQAKEYIRQQKCAQYVLRSTPVLDRCMVQVTEAAEEIATISAEIGMNSTHFATELEQWLNELHFNQMADQIVQDLVQSKWYLLGALVAVVVVCFGYILLLRWVVAPVVWVSIVGLLALLGFATYLCYKQYEYFKANPVQLIQTTNLQGYLRQMFSKAETWMVILIIVAIALVVLLLIVIFLRKRITLAIAIIQEGSKAVFAVKSTVFFPLFPWIFQCGVIVYGVVVFISIQSIGDKLFQVLNLQNDTSCSCHGQYKDYDMCDPVQFALCTDASGGMCKEAVCHFTGIDNPYSAVYLHLANLLGTFWALFFISGVSDMMLASTFSTWYWTFQKKDLPFFTLTKGITTTLTYHLGTVAFGSLIIAIVRVIRVILEYIDHKLKKFDNPFTRCVMCFCKCFCWCLENFLKFINKNAYIMCAVHGKNFCTSARDAFSLLMRNIVRVVVLDKVTDFIFFLSKLLISIGVGFAVYYLLQWKFVYEVTQGVQLHYNYIPAIILSVATYIICSLFFNVYGMAVDTLFLCFLEDCERNDGSPEKPYFMSKNLMKILGKKNKKLQ